MNNDRHWEHSDEDVCVPVVQSVTEEGIREEERDLDEIEYCAPNTLGKVSFGRWYKFLMIHNHRPPVSTAVRL